jgi:tetratricopeptide (TPR) repeat protein
MRRLVKHLYKRLKWQPKNIRLINLIAILWMELRRYDLALLFFQKAVSICATVETLNNLGCFYLYEGIPTNDGRWSEQPQQAIDLLEQALQLNPIIHNPYSLLGEVYIRKGDYIKAEQILRKGVEKKPTLENLNNLGVALYNQGKVEASLTFFKKAYTAKMMYANIFVPLYYYGMCLAILGKFQDAENIALKLINTKNEGDFIGEDCIADIYYVCQKYHKVADLYSRINNLYYSVDWVSQYLFSLYKIGSIQEMKTFLNIVIDSKEQEINDAMEREPLEDWRSTYIKELKSDISKLKKIYEDILGCEYKPTLCFKPDYLQRCYFIGCIRHEL